jgi:hypothetical protein
MWARASTLVRRRLRVVGHYYPETTGGGLQVRLARIIFAVVSSGWGCIALFWSVLRPGSLDSPKWYDRAIRMIGALIMGCLSVGIIFMALTGRL